MSERTITAIRAALLAHFDASARALPWRASRDPYRVLVSEVMAQQTRIETVIPYYERWLRRFPDVHVLADADEDDVLREWAGLGYYSRARHLHATARIIRDRYAGAVPASYADLRALPGIGDYTAGAISSIAFGVPAPAVDGNARRVLSRLLDHPDPAPSLLREWAAALVPADRPGDFNQALMELGSRTCTPRAPRCADCPLRTHCVAFAAGTQLDRPERKPKKAAPWIDMATAILRAPDGRVLLQRRAERGLLARMWSFPCAEWDLLQAADSETGDPAAEFIRRIARQFVPDADRNGSVEIAAVGVVAHSFSHRRERYHCYMVPVPAATSVVDCVWVGADAGDYALPRAQQKIHALVFADDGADAKRQFV